MSTIDATNLEIKLAQKINNTTAPLELLALGTALRQLQNGAVFVVQQFSQLPAASTNLGQLYFVIDDRIVYVSTPDIAGTASWRLLASDSISQLFTWGSNSAAQLGDGTFTCRSSPGTTQGGGNTWCQVSAGGCANCAHTAAVKTDGTAWTWGCNSFGQLGDPSVTTLRGSPGTVSGGGTTWCQISAGMWHTAAVKIDGTAWTWGLATSGQLGDNTTLNKNSPVAVVHASGNCNWCQISAGGSHTAAVKLDGTTWTWGLGTSGQLGNGLNFSRSSPVLTSGGATTWCQIDAGGNHTAAVKCNGSAWTWGANNCGQLGDNTITAKNVPVITAGGGYDWCQISAGCCHTAAVDINGCVWTWGAGDNGRLGSNSGTRASPGPVAGGGTTWRQVSAGSWNTAAIKTDGTAWMWGLGGSGQMGDNTAVTRSSPVSVVGAVTPWCQISAGFCHIAAIASKTF